MPQGFIPSSSVQFGGNQNKPEFTVDLRGGSVEWASKDKSSKKHVLEVRRRREDLKALTSGSPHTDTIGSSCS